MSWRKKAPKAMNKDLIDKYLGHQLDAQQLAEFEQKLQNNPELQKELSLRQEQLKKVSEDENVEEHSNPWPLSKRIALGIAAIIIILLSYFFIFDQPKTPEKLYSNYFQSYPDFLIGDSAIMDQRSPLYTSRIAYESGEFPLAINELKKVLAANPHNHALRTYLGLAYLENNQPYSAVVYLQAAWNARDKEYGNTAGWYLALAWLKMGEIERCVTILQDLREVDQKEYADKATDLLNEF